MGTAGQYVEGQSYSDEHIYQGDFSANLRVTLVQLPAGPLSVAVGAEHRNETFRALAGYNSAPLYLLNENNVSYHAGISVTEGYVEAGVPLLKDLPFVKSLDLNGAVRETDYSTSGSVTTWKIGGVWEPNDNWRIRATHSRDIRAPNIGELYSAGTQGRGTILNPANGVSAITSGYSIGNPNLLPEIADTTTAGIVFQPTWAWARGFRASVDYFHIKINGVIAAPAGQDVVNYCLLYHITSFCPDISFDSSAIGFSAVSTQTENQNALETDGLDLEADYRVPVEDFHVPGTFDIRALTTYTAHLRTIAPIPGGGTITTNNAGFQAGVPHWQANVNFTYNLARFMGNLQAHYESGIHYSTALIGPDNPAYSPSLSNSINRNLFPGLVYWSLSTSYDVLRSDGRKLQLFGVVDNLFDKDPPIVAMSLNTGSANYDLIGRTFRIGVRFSY